MQKFLPSVRYLILGLWISASFSAGAENHLVYFGGGLSDLPKDRMFDDNLQALLQYSKATSWKSEFYYRKKLPPGMSEEDQKIIKEFSPSSFQEKIESLKEDLRQGRIQSNDQILVYLDTHGNLNKNKDFVLTTDSGDAHSETIRSLIALAEEKKVKLGLVGMNCYSGSLLRFKSPNTCIITLSSPDRVGFSDDADRISQNILIHSGATNLEEVFLLSRFHGKGSYSPSQPMISTEAGVAVDEALFALKSGIIAKDNFVDEQNALSCKNSTLQIEHLSDSLKKISHVVQFSYQEIAWPGTYGGPGSIVDSKTVQRIQSKLKDYQSLYDQMKETAFLGDKLACGKNKTCLKASDVDVYASYKTLTGPQKRWVEEAKSTPEYIKFKESRKKHEHSYEKMKKLSKEIAKEERELYDQLYRVTSQKSSGPNPCKDFKL